MDRTRERILEYALDNISRELLVLDRTVGRDSEHFKELHEFYIKVHDEYQKEVTKNIIF